MQKHATAKVIFFPLTQHPKNKRNASKAENTERTYLLSFHAFGRRISEARVHTEDTWREKKTDRSRAL